MPNASLTEGWREGFERAASPGQGIGSRITNGTSGGWAPRNPSFRKRNAGVASTRWMGESSPPLPSLPRYIPIQTPTSATKQPLPTPQAPRRTKKKRDGKIARDGISQFEESPSLHANSSPPVSFVASPRAQGRARPLGYAKTGAATRTSDIIEIDLLFFSSMDGCPRFSLRLETRRTELAETDQRHGHSMGFSLGLHNHPSGTGSGM